MVSSELENADEHYCRENNFRNDTQGRKQGQRTQREKCGSTCANMHGRLVVKARKLTSQRDGWRGHRLMMSGPVLPSEHYLLPILPLIRKPFASSGPLKNTHHPTGFSFLTLPDIFLMSSKSIRTLYFITLQPRGHATF